MALFLPWKDWLEEGGLIKTERFQSFCSPELNSRPDGCSGHTHLRLPLFTEKQITSPLLGAIPCQRIPRPAAGAPGGFLTSPRKLTAFRLPDSWGHQKATGGDASSRGIHPLHLLPETQRQPGSSSKTFHPFSLRTSRRNSHFTFGA